MHHAITLNIAEELNVTAKQVDATIKLIDEGATIPFIARYRKEVTEGLDDTQLRFLEERLTYLRELDERKAVILKSIQVQEKLTPELEQAIATIMSKTALEDLYLPYKPKRRNKATIAREAGLEPLAEQLLHHPESDPEKVAESFVNKDKQIDDVKAALDGARQILMERFSLEPELIGTLRELMWGRLYLVSTATAAKKTDSKFSDYFEFRQLLKETPSHRVLAMNRGRNEGELQLELVFVDEDAKLCERSITKHFQLRDEGRPGDQWLMETVRWTWRIKLCPKLELEVMTRLKMGAEDGAIDVFATNLKALLLTAPAGPRAILGLDPGLRTGVKVAVVDITGKVVDTVTIYPHAPKNQWEQAIHVLNHLITKHNVELVSVGNGTASRETDRLVLDVMKHHPKGKIDKVMVSEAGASVYSASELAAKEFPDLDVTLRGAVSIARRLQDPLAELVKIEPKAIGVGQYQHDVNQVKLSRSLNAVVEDCVNAVGVDVNTASVPLLARVSGLNQTLAHNIVTYRDSNGRFKDRLQLKKIPRFGAKTFEQAAGFLRIINGENPLDGSAVHPEAYPVVKHIANQCQRPIHAIIGDTRFIKGLVATDYMNGQFGLPTINDIFSELEKPGRDPRPEFKTATFKDGIEKIADLKEGMVLEGVVTNVTNFGAFVDVGVHQDGLVHVSALSDKFVKDPHEVVKAGEIVKVKVISIDIKRNRIALTCRLQDKVEPKDDVVSAKHHGKKPVRQGYKNQVAQPDSGTSMANALAQAMMTQKTSR